MKTRITIITPVHIGTGEQKMSFEYNINNKYAYNYHLKDLLGQLPDKQLLDTKFLNNLYNNKNGSKVKFINETFRRFVNYRELQNSYKLKCNFKFLPYSNVEEQIKSLDKPIIPGSSLKGAIMNAIYYDFIKQNLICLYNALYDKKRINNLEQLLEMKYENEPHFKDFLKQFSSCIICRDVSFNNMILLETQRYQIYKNNELSIKIMSECIDTNQYIEDNIICIDKAKKNILEKHYGNYKYYKEFSQYLIDEKILTVSKEYFHDMINEELEVDYETGYYRNEYLDKKLNELYKEDIDRGFYLRIGGHTNYFFKTISYAVKKDNPQIYERYFYKYFSPKNKPKGKGAYPLPDQMPATRTLFYDDQYVYYPGVIKIEFIK